MVYFVRNPETGLIKIGWSIRHSVRIKVLEAEEGVPLAGLGVLAGERPLEGELHERFADIKDHGEWFRPEPELLDFIGEKAQPFEEPDTAPGVKTIQLRADIHRTARVLAAYYKKGVSALINDILEPIMEDMLHEYMAQTKTTRYPDV